MAESVYYHVTKSLSPEYPMHEVVTAAKAEACFTLEPKPAFVLTVPFARTKVARSELPGGGAFLLVHEEVNLDETVTQYFRYVIELCDERGVQNYSNLTFDFDPSFQKLTIHSVDLWRDGSVISKAHRDHFQLLRRESNLERFLYDGRYTVSTVMSDVRVNDIVEYSFSITGINPVFEGKFSRQFNLGWSMPIERSVLRIHRNRNVPLFWRTFSARLEPTVSIVSDKELLVWDFQNLPAVLYEDATPSWAVESPRIELSQFASWGEVRKWAQELFTLNESAREYIRAVARRCKDASDPPSAAADFVQNEIRYMGIEIGPYSHRPALPTVVDERRYGDCKEKAFIMSEVLKELGIQAHVCLVHTYRLRSLKNVLPSPDAFNHAVVYVAQKLNQSAHLFDATLQTQSGPLHERWVYDYRQVLVLDGLSSSLTEIPLPPVTASTIKRHDQFTINKWNKPTLFKTSCVRMGAEAQFDRWAAKQTRSETILQQDNDFYSQIFGKVTPIQRPTWTDDHGSRGTTRSSSYYLHDFLEHPEHKDFYFLDMYAYSVARRLPFHGSAQRKYPVEVTFPLSVEHRIDLDLPERARVKGSSLSIEGSSFTFSRNVVRSKRHVTITFRFDTRLDTIGPEGYQHEKTLLQEVATLCAFRMTRPKKALWPHALAGAAAVLIIRLVTYFLHSSK